MYRLLLALFPLLVIVPHLIPMPDRAVGDKKQELPEVVDVAQRLPSGSELLGGEWVATVIRLIQRLPSGPEMDVLAEQDPLAFLEHCLRRYDREVQGYQAILHKHERINGKLEKKEVIDVWFRQNPHSVFMKWKSGQRLAARALFVEGENDGKIVVKPAGLAVVAGVQTRDPRGADARRSGRYTLDEFGIKMGMQRSLEAWHGANQHVHGVLSASTVGLLASPIGPGPLTAGAGVYPERTVFIEYLGKKAVEELGGRECWVLRRYKYAAPEADGVIEQLAYVDCETWLLAGTVVKGEEDKLIGEYVFRDVRLNPVFDEDQFTPKVVSK